MNRRFFRQTKASTLPEAAVVLALMLPMLVGSIEISLMMWTKGTMQSIAALSARCIATNSTNCTANASYPTDVLRTQNYALTMANALISQAKITAANITVTTSTTCNNAPGQYDVVSITYSDWFGAMIAPLGARTDKLTACYPI